MSLGSGNRTGLSEVVIAARSTMPSRSRLRSSMLRIDLSGCGLSQPKTSRPTSSRLGIGHVDGRTVLLPVGRPPPVHDLLLVADGDLAARAIRVMDHVVAMWPPDHAAAWRK